MKADLYKNSIFLSILPVIFFISGLFSILKPFLTTYKCNTYDILVLAVLLIVGSYLFLRDVISAIINLCCTVNALFGILFLIDLFKVKYSSLSVAAIIISLSFSVFLNTILLCGVHRNKRPFEREAEEAVKITLFRNIWMILLSLSTFILVIFFIFYNSCAIEVNYFLIISVLGSIIAVLTSVTLLPLLCTTWLGHVNEERMQDDLELSFTENILLHFNIKIEKAAALMFWFVSPILNIKTAWFIIAAVAMLIGFFGFLSFKSTILAVNSLPGIGLVLYFLVVVIRYKSYILAVIPVLFICTNYFLISEFSKVLFTDSIALNEICLSCSLIVTAIGAYMHLDAVLHYKKANLNLKDAVLNASAETLYVFFAAVTVLIIFIMAYLYLNAFNNYGFEDFLQAGLSIILSATILLFPGPAVLYALINLHDHWSKPAKKRIKSIYL